MHGAGEEGFVFADAPPLTLKQLTKCSHPTSTRRVSKEKGLQFLMPLQLETRHGDKITWN